MHFKFRHLCDLLQALDENRLRGNPTREKSRTSDASIITAWFKKHEQQIPRHGDAAVAFLSCLFPERRPDRVYNVQEKRLEKIVGRILALGTTRLAQLSAWRVGDGAEFAQTVQKVMSEAEFDPPNPEHEVTLEQIDSVFDQIAAWYNGSSPDLRMRIQDPIRADQALPRIVRRLQSTEVKWLLRMFFKSFSPVILPESLVLRQYHFLLPDVLRLQNCFSAAISFLNDPNIAKFCPRPIDQQLSIRAKAAGCLKPQTGIMIQRPPYNKARSLQHCCTMAARRRISVERKYDGEYCQVHVDLNQQQPIKIFSKGGKDSTRDRVRLVGAIESALNLKKKGSLVKTHCILEGELVIWHEKHQTIQPFEKIRKHVTRNGRFLGNEQDSPRDLGEKPMIIFYDLLLLDDIICMNEPLEQRRSRLRSLLCRLPGQADLGYREKINFASPDAKSLLRRAFAKSISRGWEGFVLKGCDDPYFSLVGAPRCIKLKKDYIPGLGDVADLAVVGGRKDARTGKGVSPGDLSWTTFYLACMENREEVRRFSAKPRFRVIGTVSSATTTISPAMTQLLNQLGQFERLPYHPCGEGIDMVIDLKLKPPTALFKNPFVAEVVGSGFEKPQGVAYYTLRFPRISKIHQDRSWDEIMSFEELQTAAAESLSMVENEDSRLDRKWIQTLIQAESRSRFIEENSPASSSTRKLDSHTTVDETSDALFPQVSTPFVRIDTEELSGTERHHRDVLSSARSYSSCSPSDLGTLSLKRKLKLRDCNEPMSTPTKRLRRSQSQTSENTTTAPTWHPKLPPRGVSCRHPLLEIQNPSCTPESTSYTSLPPRPVPPGVDQRAMNAVERNSERRDNPPAVAAQEQATPSMDPVSTSPTQRVLGETPLPTPPTISAQEGQDETQTSFVHGPSEGMEASQETVSAEACISSHWRSAHDLIFSPRCSPLFFLSTATATIAHNQKPTRLLDLAVVDISFTFCRETFLDSPQNTPCQTRVAIVNIANPTATGLELVAFRDLISKRLEESSHPNIGNRGQLILFDQQLLRLLRTPPRDENYMAHLKHCFGGCLVWGRPRLLHRHRRSDGAVIASGGVTTTAPVAHIEAVWNWNTILELLAAS